MTDEEERRAIIVEETSYVLNPVTFSVCFIVCFILLLLVVTVMYFYLLDWDDLDDIYHAHNKQSFSPAYLKNTTKKRPSMNKTKETGKTQSAEQTSTKTSSTETSKLSSAQTSNTPQLYRNFKYEILCSYNPIQLDALHLTNFTVDNLPQELCSHFVYDSFILKSVKDSFILPDHKIHQDPKRGFKAFNSAVTKKILGFMGTGQDEKTLTQFFEDISVHHTIIESIKIKCKDASARGVMILKPQLFRDEEQAAAVTAFSLALDHEISHVYVEVSAPNNIERYHTEDLTREEIHIVLSSYPLMRTNLQELVCLAAIGLPDNNTQHKQLLGHNYALNEMTYGTRGNAMTMFGISLAPTAIGTTSKVAFNHNITEKHRIVELTLKDFCQSLSSERFKTSMVQDKETNCAHIALEQAPPYAPSEMPYWLYTMISPILNMSVFLEHYRDLNGIFIQDFLYDDVYGETECSNDQPFPMLSMIRRAFDDFYATNNTRLN